MKNYRNFTDMFKNVKCLLQLLKNQNFSSSLHRRVSFSNFFFHMFFEIALILASKKRTYFLEARIFQFCIFLFFRRESGKEEKKGQFLPNSKRIYFSPLFSTFFSSSKNLFSKLFHFSHFMNDFIFLFFSCFFISPIPRWAG